MAAADRLFSEPGQAVLAPASREGGGGGYLTAVSDVVIPARLRPALDVLEEGCHRDESVVAAWLGGSLARGVADDWSDIDLHVLVEDAGAFDSRVEVWLGHLAPVLVDRIPGVAGGFIVVTPDWVRVDLIVHEVAGFEQVALPSAVLFDDSGLVRDIPAEEEAAASGPYLPDAPARMFMYFMGNLVTVAHRGEWLALSQGTAMMRDTLLIPLMLAENGIRKSDGVKRLNRYLSDEQHRALAAIPAIGTDRDQLLAAQEAIAREYLTRARRLATTLDALWPDALERAVKDLWRRELAVEL